MNRRVFGVSTQRKNIEGEGLGSPFVLKHQMLDVLQVGTVVGTVAGTVGHSGGHSVNNARPHIRGVLGRLCV